MPRLKGLAQKMHTSSPVATITHQVDGTSWVRHRGHNRTGTLTRTAAHRLRCRSPRHCLARRTPGSRSRGRHARAVVSLGLAGALIAERNEQQPAVAAARVMPAACRRSGRFPSASPTAPVARGYSASDIVKGVVDLERWKRCVVHLECAADCTEASERIARMQQIEQRVQAREPLSEDDIPEVTSGSRALRFRGSSVFLKHDKRHYLLTARHVLTNKELARATLERLPDWTTSEMRQHSEAALKNWAFEIVFRVPSLDEVLRGSEVHHSLMALGAGTYERAAYTFSEASVDLAVVSLNTRDKEFVDELTAAGYVPVTLDDVGEQPSAEGAEVLAVGYPGSVAVLRTMPLESAHAHWASAAVSLPVFSWGRVAMLHEALPKFWADLTIYPGNSGGPVIEDDKLVGIVSAQARVEGVRVPFANVAKAQPLRALLEAQFAKEKAREQIYGPLRL